MPCWNATVCGGGREWVGGNGGRERKERERERERNRNRIGGKAHLLTQKQKTAELKKVNPTERNST